MKIIVYSTNCPKCNILKKKMDIIGLSYELIEDVDKVVEVGQSIKMETAPFVEVEKGDHSYYCDFSTAIGKLNDWKEEQDKCK